MAQLHLVSLLITRLISIEPKPMQIKLFLLLYLGSCIKNVEQNQENLGKKNCLCQNKIQVQKTVGIKK